MQHIFTFAALAALSLPALVHQDRTKGQDLIDTLKKKVAQNAQKPVAQEPAPKPEELMSPEELASERQRVEAEYFATCDYNEDGWISYTEGKQALNMTRTGFLQYDTDVDGSITAEEFGERYRELLERTGGFTPPVPQSVQTIPGGGELDDDQASNSNTTAFIAKHDVNIDGKLDSVELETAAGDLGFTGLDGATMILVLDTDGSGFAEIAELAGALASFDLMSAAGTAPTAPKPASAEELFGLAEEREVTPGSNPRPPVVPGPARPFRRLDIDASGAITVEDLTTLSVSAHPRFAAAALVATLDLNDDGELSPAELAAAFDG